MVIAGLGDLLAGLEAGGTLTCRLWENRETRGEQVDDRHPGPPGGSLGDLLSGGGSSDRKVRTQRGGQKARRVTRRTFQEPSSPGSRRP